MRETSRDDFAPMLIGCWRHFGRDHVMQLDPPASSLAGLGASVRVKPTLLRGAERSEPLRDSSQGTLQRTLGLVPRLTIMTTAFRFCKKCHLGFNFAYSDKSQPLGFRFILFIKGFRQSTTVHWPKRKRTRLFRTTAGLKQLTISSIIQLGSFES